MLRSIASLIGLSDGHQDKDDDMPSVQDGGGITDTAPSRAAWFIDPYRHYWDGAARLIERSTPAAMDGHAYHVRQRSQT